MRKDTLIGLKKQVLGRNLLKKNLIVKTLLFFHIFLSASTVPKKAAYMLKKRFILKGFMYYEKK
jgi:hypothetical protein